MPSTWRNALESLGVFANLSFATLFDILWDAMNFLSDSKTLIDAEQAYLESGGSFDAVIVSLLTSDSFIYRKPIEKTFHD